MIRTAEPEAIRRWLNALGLQCAGAAPVEEVRLKAMAYADTLADKPAYWWTRGTLRAAATRFAWFPAVAELVKFMDAETDEKAQQVRAARQTVNGENAPRPRFTPEPRAVRLEAVIDSVTRHFGADDPRVAKARAELEAERAKAATKAIDAEEAA